MSRRILLSFYVLSFVGHASAAVVMSRIERAPEAPERYEVVVQDTETPEEAEPPPPPPPIEVPVQQPVARTRSTERAVAADPVAAEAPAAAEGAPPPPMAFGVVMGNSSGPGGIAVAVGDPGGVVGGTGTTRTRVRAAQDLVAAAPTPAGSEADTCAGETSRPNPISMAHPRYTEAGRTAAIEGRVRIRMEIDANGVVTSATVISGLGFGLDEAAVEAALASRFEPALECGRPVAASVSVGIRFSL